jgi:hypothetical protein
MIQTGTFVSVWDILDWYFLILVFGDGKAPDLICAVSFKDFDSFEEGGSGSYDVVDKNEVFWLNEIFRIYISIN